MADGSPCASRSASVPDVPTFAELGIPGLDSGLWMALVAPKGTPAEVVATLNQALAAALNTPTLKEKFAKLGASPLNPSASAYAERISADTRAWSPVLKAVNFTVD